MGDRTARERRFANVRRIGYPHCGILTAWTRFPGKYNTCLVDFCNADFSQTGQYKKYEDLPADSILHHFPRFHKDVFDENVKLVHEVEKIASKKGVSSVQIAVGWVLAQSGRNGNATFIPIPGATTSERIKENMKPAKLSEEDISALDEILKKFPPMGDRYHKEAMKFSEL